MANTSKARKAAAAKIETAPVTLVAPVEVKAVEVKAPVKASYGTPVLLNPGAFNLARPAPLLDAFARPVAVQAPAPALPAATPAKRDPRQPVPKNWLITLLVENPKRGKSRERFAQYKTGMTVGEYLEACVKVEGRDAKQTFKYHADINWDLERGFIEVNPPK